MSKTPPNVDRKEQTKQRALTITGIVLCLLLLPILIVNVTLIVKSYINTDEVPSIGGISPLIVLTDSMLPEISSGDLIITKQIDPADVKVGDVISFFDPAGNGSSVVTHRVIEIVTENGETKWRTRGDNNNTEDSEISVGLIKGEVIGHIGGAGAAIRVLKSPLVSIGMLGLSFYLLERSYRKEKKQNDDTLDALKEEIRRLRDDITQQNGNPEEKTND